VSRQAKELMIAKLLKMMTITTLLAVVVVDIWRFTTLFVEIQIFDADFGRQIRIVGVDLVELIGKESILRLGITANR